MFILFLAVFFGTYFESFRERLMRDKHMLYDGGGDEQQLVVPAARLLLCILFFLNLRKLM